VQSNYLPWYNVNQIAFLQQRLVKLQNFDVFEYGGGASSLYYLPIVKSLCLSESREQWFNFVVSNANKEHLCKLNAKHVTKNFAASIELFDRFFDLIVVDSNERAKCLDYAVKHLKPDGWIILDNSERQNLTQAKQKLLDNGFKSLDFCGKKPQDVNRDDAELSYSTIFTKGTF
jgi:tRNA A58 N-methylase Trm61